MAAAKNRFWGQLSLFIIIYLLVLFCRRYVSTLLIAGGTDSFQSHALLSIACNLTVMALSYYFIRKNGLVEIGGLKGNFFNKSVWSFFP